MKKVKVRFNLGKGKNYLKWKVQMDDRITYVDPEEKNLLMFNCRLKNNRKTAEKILNGEHKTVCAWIICEGISIVDKDVKTFKTLKRNRLKYNPRELPYWHINEVNVDNMEYDIILSKGRELYIRKLKDIL